jgi:hypothetical protein
MAKTPAHVVVPGKVYEVTGNRQDNGNGLYYEVWAHSPEQARAYLQRTDLAGIAVTFTACQERSDLRYEQTINCKLDHPERYQDRWARWQPE